MQEVLDYLYNLERFGIKLGLDVIKELLHKLDNPQNKFKSVHIAGTNGKGSTACFLDSILRSSGKKVGLYTSPHLVKFNERIQINGKDISDLDLVRLTTKIKNICEQNKIEATFFEFTTAIAFLYFAENNVDYSVIETGLGGRLDATNVLTPELSLITNIDIDHTKHLGDTKEKIAVEKAGIIKENSLVLTAEQDPSILEIFSNVCKEKKSKLCVLDDKFDIKLINSDLHGQEFSVTGKMEGGFTIKMLGQHQIRNAVLAIMGARKLGISQEEISEGLKNAYWPARLDIIKQDPLVLVDCAHNLAGITELVNFLKGTGCDVGARDPLKISSQNFCPSIGADITKIDKKKTLLLGTSEDKQISEMLKLLVPFFDKVVLTQGNFKPASLELLEDEVRKYCSEVYAYSDLKEAIPKAIELTNDNEMLVITGSIYLVGDVLGHRNLFK
jgi:dihydrofolate synthase / folylpolyglutamate synthase